MKFKLWLATCLFLVISSVLAPVAQASILVGRVAYVEGDFLRYVAEEEDWAATVANTPAGAQDVFSSGEDSKVEIIFPNNIMLRVGGLTELDITTIENDLGEFFVNSGIIRAYNNSADADIKIETPLGYGVLAPKTTADIYVSNESVEILAVRGSVNFIYARENEPEARYDVTAGSNSLIVTDHYVEAGDGSFDAQWDDWCLEREDFWKKRRRVRSAHLPENMQEYAYDLEENGQWERIYYNGYHYWSWRPLHVSVDWAPFTTGRWTVWHNDHVWTPYEPWGWSTHHHGHWIHVRGGWWWTPYIHLDVAVPGVRIVGTGFRFGLPFRPFWHPGRVVWLSTHTYVGWAPLSPRETYYGWRKWGPRTTVVSNTSLRRIHISLHNYRHIERAFIVPHRSFYGVGSAGIKNYRLVRVKKLSRTRIIHDYKAAPVFHKKFIRNHKRLTTKNKYNFVNRKVHYKPHKTVARSIKVRHERLERRQRPGPVVSKTKIQQIRKGKLAGRKAGRTRVRKHTVTNKWVRAEDVNKSGRRVQFKKRDLHRKRVAQPKRKTIDRRAPTVKRRKSPAKRPEARKRRLDQQAPSLDRQRQESKKPRREKKGLERRQIKQETKQPVRQKSRVERPSSRRQSPTVRQKIPARQPSALERKPAAAKKAATIRKGTAPRQPKLEPQRPKVEKPRGERKRMERRQIKQKTKRPVRQKSRVERKTQRQSPKVQQKIPARQPAAVERKPAAAKKTATKRKRTAPQQPELERQNLTEEKQLLKRKESPTLRRFKREDR